MAPFAHIRRMAVALGFLALTAAPLPAQDLGWDTYSDPGFGYRIDVPSALFDEPQDADGKVLFQGAGSGAQLSVYGADAAGQQPQDIAAALEQSDWIEEVTYRKGGASWFVMSGYYADEAGRGDDLIFYLKLMMSPDRSRYAVFAISYPQADRELFDPVVERMEDSFRGPA